MPTCRRGRRTPTRTARRSSRSASAGEPGGRPVFPVIIATAVRPGRRRVGADPDEAQARDLPGRDLRLSNFLGDYGAGRTVKTFSLLPGEKPNQHHDVQERATTPSASSIFDSFTEDTADEFETSIQSENSATELEEKTKPECTPRRRPAATGVSERRAPGRGVEDRATARARSSPRTSRTRPRSTPPRRPRSATYQSTRAPRRGRRGRGDGDRARDPEHQRQPRRSTSSSVR